MANIKHNFFSITQKKLNTPKDFRSLVPMESIHIKIENPCYFTMPVSETDSFIVDWQMTTVYRQ